jgi:hypothetical protein
VQDDGSETGWLTLAEAARALGVSVDTMRRRLKRGEVEHRQASTRYGRTWQVRLGRARGDLPTVGEAPTQPAEGHLVTELLHLIERLQADYRAAAERHEQTVMELSGRIGYLRAELAGARERILALEAPKVEPEPAPDGEATSRRATRRRWRSWEGRRDGALH